MNIYTKSCNGIVGFAIGDALGVPAEYKTRIELKNHPITDMIGYGTYYEPEGTWSDDTSMTLATMDSICEKATIDTNNMGDKFLEWFRNAKYTATNKCFDIGETTSHALSIYETKKCNASNCGRKNKYDNGNGSLMRMLPIVYYIHHKKITDTQKIYNIIKEVSSITHAHKISILGCYIYVQFALELLNGEDKINAYRNIRDKDYSMFSIDTIKKYDRILNCDIKIINKNKILTDGYIVDTLEATIWLFLNSHNYNSAILEAVNMGEDTDTVAACTGGLLGIYYGIENIKDKWKKQIKRYDYIIKLCKKFDNVLE